MDDELTLKEASSKFNVSYELLYYHVMKKNLITRRQGSRHFVKVIDVDNLLRTTKSRGVARTLHTDGKIVKGTPWTHPVD